MDPQRASDLQRGGPPRRPGHRFGWGGGGGAIIAWQDARNPNDALGGDIYAQRIMADGTTAPGWSANGISVCTVLGDESVLDMIPDGSGGAIIAWSDYREGSSTQRDIYAQRITATGVIASGWPIDGLAVCTANFDQRRPKLCGDGGGGAFITWDDPRNTPFDEVYAQRVIGDGAIAPGWPSNGIRIARGTNPSIASDGAGGAIITWTSKPPIRAVRIMGDGTLASGWSVGGNVVGARGDLVTIVGDGAGGGFIAWHDFQGPATLFDVHLQRVRGDGQISPGWPAVGLLVNGAVIDPFGQDVVETGPQLAPDGSGGVVLTWIDGRNEDLDIYGQRFTATGAISSGWVTNGTPVARTAGIQDYPKLVGDGVGGAYFCWRDARNGGEDIFAQHLTGEGAVAPGWTAEGNPVCNAQGDQFAPTIASDGEGGAILTWFDYRADPVNYVNADIYAQRISSEALVALDFSPSVLNLASQGLWVTGSLEPASPFAATDIDVASLRLNGTVPVDTSAPTTIGDINGNGIADLTVKFNRAMVELALASGDSVPVTVTGAVDGHPFSATDYIRVRRAVVSAPPAGSHLTAGSVTQVRWQTPGSVTVE